MDRKAKIHIWYLLLAVLGVVLLRDWLTEIQQTETITYSEFQTLLADGKIADVGVSPDQIVGPYKKATEANKTQFVTSRVDQPMADELTKSHVTFYGLPASGLFKSLISWILPTAAFVLL